MINLVIVGALYAGAKAYDLKKSNASEGSVFASFSVQKAKVAFQKFKEEKIKPLLGKERDVQVLTRPSDDPEMDDKGQMVEQNLAISSLSLAMATTGVLFSSPLMVLGAVPAAVATIPIYRTAYDSFAKEGKIGVAALDSATFTIAIITGQYFAVALAPYFYYYSRKVLIERESEAAKELTVLKYTTNDSVFIDGSNVVADTSTLMKGEVITVNAGETIPVDGSITSGQALVDERGLTGNLFPIEKKVGEPVFASTVVLTGCISVIVENTASETMAAQISQILTTTAGSRTSLRLAGQDVADTLVLPTAMLGLLTYPFLGLVSMGNIFNADLAYQMRALGPIALLNYLKVAREKGILIKNTQALALLNVVNSVVLEADALLEELPTITQIHAAASRSGDDLLRYAAAVYKEGDPITVALRQLADKHGLSVPNVGDAKLEMKDGVRAKLFGMMIRVGNLSFMKKEGLVIPGEVRIQLEAAKTSGATLLLIAIGARLSGAIELQPTIRPEAKVVIQQLKERDLSLMIVSTRSEEATKNVAQALHINDYFANLLPQERISLFEKFIHDGKLICYVGDDMQNQPALKMSLTSISLRGREELVTNEADVILMDQSLTQLVELFEIANGLASNASSSLMATTIPGILGATGTILLGMGLIPSIILNHIGLRIGYLNTMQPLNTTRPEVIDSTVSQPSHVNRQVLANKQ